MSIQSSLVPFPDVSDAKNASEKDIIQDSCRRSSSRHDERNPITHLEVVSPPSENGQPGAQGTYICNQLPSGPHSKDASSRRDVEGTREESYAENLNQSSPSGPGEYSTARPYTDSSEETGTQGMDTQKPKHRDGSSAQNPSLSESVSQGPLSGPVDEGDSSPRSA